MVQRDVKLTVADAVALLVAIIALHDSALGLNSLLGAVLRSVSELLTVVTLGLSHPGDNVPGISQTLQDLVMVLGPTLALRLAKGLLGEAVVDCILLAKVTLEIHVGQGDGEVGTLLGN